MLTNEDTHKLQNVEEELEDVTNAKKADGGEGHHVPTHYLARQRGYGKENAAKIAS